MNRDAHLEVALHGVRQSRHHPAEHWPWIEQELAALRLLAEAHGRLPRFVPLTVDHIADAVDDERWAERRRYKTEHQRRQRNTETTT